VDASVTTIAEERATANQHAFSILQVSCFGISHLRFEEDDEVAKHTEALSIYPIVIAGCTDQCHVTQLTVAVM
jgi:hypothetical protein